VLSLAHGSGLSSLPANKPKTLLQVHQASEGSSAQSDSVQNDLVKSDSVTPTQKDSVQNNSVQIELVQNVSVPTSPIASKSVESHPNKNVPDQTASISKKTNNSKGLIDEDEWELPFEVVEHALKTECTLLKFFKDCHQLNTNIR